jgi:hypothetical protein
MTTFNPTPHLRWFVRPVTFTDDKPGIPVLQIGYRPINGGEIQWHDVPVVHAKNEQGGF